MLNFLHAYYPQSVLFNIGGISVHWYGLILAAAMLLGYFVATGLARHRGWPSESIGSIYINLLFWGVVGARLYHVLNDWPSYWQNPLVIFKIWQGGLAIHGGIIAGAAALFYYGRKHRLSFWSLADLFSLPLILGQALGRWGNYFNQELFGRPASLPWGIPIAPPNRPVGFEQYQYFHPTFLYEFLWDGLAFFILLWLYRKNPLLSNLSAVALAEVEEGEGRRPAVASAKAGGGSWGRGRTSGKVFSWYLTLYGLGRVGVELLRIDSVPLMAGIRLPLIVSGFIVLSGVIILRRRREPREN